MGKLDLSSSRESAGPALPVVLAALIAVALPGCGLLNYDSFQGTDPLFTLDKDVYSVGDTIRLTLEFHGHSRIRVYENIEKTLNVGLVFRVPYQGEYTTAAYDGIHSQEINPRDPGQIHTYQLVNSQPLRFTFSGHLQETATRDAFLIVFPDLNRRFIVHRAQYSRALALEIHGYLSPINPHPLDSQEDYLTPVRLSIQW